ncbi:MAG: hypothetical protein HQ594_02695 [Candidatus Omnitrophica bacterium]|nr:hypothetical protein [Candidatus Omnitrophota bacterium]
MTKTKTRIYLYSLLIISVLMQIVLMRHLNWFPDIILLMAVFTGIFMGPGQGAVFGSIAGLLRGTFSAGTVVLDIFLFSLLGVMSSLLAKKFYRQNPVFQIAVTMAASFIVVAVHTLYLNFVSGNDLTVPFVILSSRMHLAVTVLISPFVFILLKKILRLEE